MLYDLRTKQYKHVYASVSGDGMRERGWVPLPYISVRWRTNEGLLPSLAEASLSVEASVLAFVLV